MKFLGLSFLAGLVSALGFAPLGMWLATLAAFAALILLIETAPTLRSALARGWWFGLGQFVLGLNWIATAFTYQAAMPAWLGWVAVVLLSFYLAIYPAAAAGLAWRWGKGGRVVLTLILAAAWIVTEWLRGSMFTGFAWNPVGVVLIDSPFVLPAPVIGTYALSGVVVLLSGLILPVLLMRGWRFLAGIVLLAAISQVPAFWWRPTDHTALAARPAIRIVQPNIPQEERWDPDVAARNFLKQPAMTGPSGHEPRLIFWPESAIPYNLDTDAEARRAIASIIGPGDLLLAGGITQAPPPPGAQFAEYNSLFVLGPGARILARYDKAHLVPYGEYLPMRPLLSAIGLSRLAPGAGDILAGPGPRTLDLPGFGRMAGQICYEIVFSGEVVDRANRPDFLFNPSNDAWFGAWGPPQHFAQARLRALEEGIAIVRATPTGISALIDANGRIVASLPQHEAGVIDTRLPPPVPPTLFARFGNLLAFAFALLLIAAAIAVRRKTR
ncbi:MAG TPA: apolipoprotein N-acyltransferase [Allosphingosinicella sp.]|nr:apolipoprotein N-acyltransferase [Allosphingosinicella sp.]